MALKESLDKYYELEDRKVGRLEGRLFNKSNLSEILQEQLINTSLSTLQPFNLSTAMMTQDEVLLALRETGALLSGHFELRSGLHSPEFFQCANLLRYPRRAEKLCAALAALVPAGAAAEAKTVVSPALGGILVGHEVARALDKKCIFAEKVPGQGVDATGKPNTVLALRRFKIAKGERYVVAEDVITKGGRVQETIDLVKAAGGKVAAVIVLVDRSSGKVKFGRTPVFSLVQMTPSTWTAAECPMCKAGGHPVHPGS